MKALKGFLIYVGIVLAMILGIGIILFAVMYFVPSFRLMGVGVVHHNDTRDNAVIELAKYSDYDNIEINVSSKRIQLDVQSSSKVQNIEYALKLNNFGIAFDIVEYKVVKSVDVKDSILKVNLNITEPEGMISDTSSVFVLTLPDKYAYDLILKTTDGNIYLKGGNSGLKINKLTTTTGTGDLNLSNVGQTIGTTTNLILDTLNMTTSSGKMNLNTINNLTVKNPIKLNSSNGTFNFVNVNAGFNVAGTGVKLNANTINTDINGFKFISENGFFDIVKLITPTGAENTIVTEHCNVEIDEITGRTAIINTFGNINLGTINSNIVLESEHGNVNVTLAKEDIRVETDFGNISVNAYQKNGKFVSRKGNINVRSTGDYVQGAYTQIENEDGQINVDNKINRLLVTTTGSSKVEITFREIKGGLEDPNDVFQHKVNLSNYSSAIVYMPTANYKTPFKFKAKGNISGEISGLTSVYEGDEVKSSDDFQFFPSASAESQTECQKSCYFEFYGTIEFKGYINR